MTLIANVCSKDWIIQASDRLVTRSARPVDKNANKTVLFEARDAILSISYSGVAFLEGSPTDEWIAGKLQSARRPKDPDTRVIPGVGMLCAFLQNELKKAVQNLDVGPNKQQLVVYVTVCGWQWPKGKLSRARSVIYEFVVERDEEKPSPVHRLGRWWFLDKKMAFSFIPPQAKGIVQEFGARLDETSDRAGVTEEVLKLMKSVSESSEVVSANCLQVYLPRPGTGDATVTYARLPGESATIETDDTPDSSGVARRVATPVRPAYCPWVITKGVVVPPSLLVGGMSLQFGPMKLTLEGGSAEKSSGYQLLGGFFPQQRPIGLSNRTRRGKRPRVRDGK